MESASFMKVDEVAQELGVSKSYDDGLENLRNVEEMLDTAPEYQLSEPQGFMTAKAYKTKIAEPLIQKLKALKTMPAGPESRKTPS